VLYLLLLTLLLLLLTLLLLLLLGSHGVGHALPDWHTLRMHCPRRHAVHRLPNGHPCACISW
jgi:hypothetical protein